MGLSFKEKVARTIRLITPRWARWLILKASKKRKSSGKKKIVTKEELAAGLRKIGLRDGDFVMAHVSLSSLGRVKGGPSAVIDALVETVGKKGTVMMPCFTRLSGNAKDGITFDASTPTNTGSVHETFRKMSGVKRSLHPTHSVCALGPMAEEAIENHEESDTSFGPGTPFDTLVNKGGKILLVGNNNSTLVHWIELKAGLPNTHHDAPVKAVVTNEKGKAKKVTVKLHTLGERLIRVDDSPDNDPDYALLQDYCLIPFPGRKAEAQAQGFLRRKSPFLEERQRQLEKADVLKFGRVGEAPCVLMDAGPFARKMVADLKRNISKFSSYYEEAAALSDDWREIQWYYLVWKNKLGLRLLKLFRRLFQIR